MHCSSKGYARLTDRRYMLWEASLPDTQIRPSAAYHTQAMHTRACIPLSNTSRHPMCDEPLAGISVNASPPVCLCSRQRAAQGAGTTTTSN